ncbi:MAG: hypothetical protein PHQ98_01255 [Candidatus ainarchaeum sp.]|nr:hypothetical protein [Candidatus ainarchaeum sp.]
MPKIQPRKALRESARLLKLNRSTSFTFREKFFRGLFSKQVVELTTKCIGKKRFSKELSKRLDSLQGALIEVVGNAKTAEEKKLCFRVINKLPLTPKERFVFYKLIKQAYNEERENVHLSVLKIKLRPSEVYIQAIDRSIKSIFNGATLENIEERSKKSVLNLAASFTFDELLIIDPKKRQLGKKIMETIFKRRQQRIDYQKDVNTDPHTVGLRTEFEEKIGNFNEFKERYHNNIHNLSVLHLLAIIEHGFNSVK